MTSDGRRGFGCAADGISGVTLYDYGMRDFDVVDPDGNQLTFGMGIDR